MKQKKIPMCEETGVSEEDIYSEENLEEMYDDDTISAGEYGFMMGYLKGVESEE
jgi:hypothetical protein